MTLVIWKKPIGYILYQYLWHLFDLLYPPSCSGCHTPGVRWCTKCLISCTKPGKLICPICGVPQFSSTPCEQCMTTPPPYVALRSWGLFDGPLREAIHALKYKRDMGIAEMLSRSMIADLKSYDWRIDLIVCVPVSPMRLQQRGYNHAGLLALPISLSLGISYQVNALKRHRDFPTQVGHSFTERIENVREAFEANDRLVSGKNILIIDDVITTTATMQACSSALLKAGARQVYGYSLARTPRKINKDKKNY